jgi:hypothetical protein
MKYNIHQTNYLLWEYPFAFYHCPLFYLLRCPVKMQAKSKPFQATGMMNSTGHSTISVRLPTG